jgi:methylglyoxal synthase
MTDHAPAHKSIALVAHDNCKIELVEWVECNRDGLRRHHLIAT